jgi:hypothetical protein
MQSLNGGGGIVPQTQGVVLKKRCPLCGNEFSYKNIRQIYCSYDCQIDYYARQQAIKKGRKPAGMPKRLTQQYLIGTLFNLYWIHNVPLKDIEEIVGLSSSTIRTKLIKWQEMWDYHRIHRAGDDGYYFDLLLRGIYNDKGEEK